MSDELHTAPVPLPPEAEGGVPDEPKQGVPGQGMTDTSGGVTNADPAATEGPNIAGQSHETGEDEARNAASVPTGPATGAQLLPGPFVAPSSYLRPLNSSSGSRAQTTHTTADATESGTGQQMAVRKASNPVEREQIEGLVSLGPFSFLQESQRTHAPTWRLKRKFSLASLYKDTRPEI